MSDPIDPEASEPGPSDGDRTDGGRSAGRLLLLASTVAFIALLLVLLPAVGSELGSPVNTEQDDPVQTNAGEEAPAQARTLVVEAEGDRQITPVEAKEDNNDEQGEENEETEPQGGEENGTGESWAPLTLIPILDVGRYGAIGDGQVDDTEALQRAVDAVPEGGGIVWLPPGRTYRTTNVIRVTGDHTKLWAPNGQAEIRPSATIGERRHALIIEEATGVGVYGLSFRSDGDRRRTALEDSTVVVDQSNETEVIGLEISGSPSAAIFIFGASSKTWVVGNDLYNNWADGVHFTDGSRRAWVWDNVIINDERTKGDDGVACVTYGTSARCGSMEWWDNSYLGGGWGRGLSVVGGDNIDIHDNLVMDTAAAGILVASEPSYDIHGSDDIRIERNVVCRAGHTVPHSGILISGLDGAISDVLVAGNEVIDSVTGQPFRSEGEVVGLVERDTSVADEGRCEPRQNRGEGQVARDTSILATRDDSFVPSSARPGLSRIHVRSGSGGGFEQRLEYVVAGPGSAVDAFLGDRFASATRFRPQSAGDEAEEYVVLLTGSPLSIPDELRPIEFDELRAVAKTLPELWAYLDDFG